MTNGQAAFVYALTMEILNLRRLNQLVTVADYGSITEAADQLEISASTLSLSLKKLEISLNVTLFIRKPGQGITMTPEGASVVVKARELLDQATEFSESLPTKGGVTIEVGSLVTVAPLVVPRLVAEYRVAGGGNEISLRTGAQDVLIEQLSTGVIHLAVTYDIDLPTSIDFMALLEARPHVLLPAGHGLATKKSVSLGDLVAEPYLALDLPLSREYFFSLFMAEGIDRTPDLLLTDLELVRSAVGNGLGWSLVNMVPSTNLAPDGTSLAYVPLKTRHPSIWLGVATLKGRRLPSAIDEFTAAAQRTLGQ